MNKIISAIAILICQFSIAQITQENIEEFRKIPKNYQLDILEQKKNGETFTTTKHTRYVLILENNKIQTQKVYDTLYHKVVLNTKRNYKHNKKGYLQTIEVYDSNDKLKEKNIFNYEKGKVINKIILNAENEEVEQINYQYNNCKSDYISDSIDDDEIQEIESLFKCETNTTIKKISNYQFTTVKVFKIGTGLIKKIELKSDVNSPISKEYKYYYNENGNVHHIDLIKKDYIKQYKTFTYNLQGDIIKIKAGYSELNYSYKYDKNENWIEKIETPKVKRKRRVFKRTFHY